MKTVSTFVLLILFSFAALTDDGPSAPVGRHAPLDKDVAAKTLRDQAVDDLGFNLPKGTDVEIDDTAGTVNQVRTGGKLSFSSTGYVKVKRVLDFPDAVSEETKAAYAKASALPGGVYVTALAVQSVASPVQMYQPLVAKEPGPGFLKYYREDGKPKPTFTQQMTKRFGANVNKAIAPDQQTDAEKEKWAKIFEQLQLVANREKPTLRRLLWIDYNEAQKRSRQFESSNAVSLEGAWSVAVLGTAQRHGFENVPCAEFMSEILRQAYARAGYSHFDDFTKEKNNVLDFAHDAAAVEVFSQYLNKAGWIPWDAAFYIPPTGAFMMNGAGRTPGHTYMIAGDQGRFIIDNGSPQGRDLRATSEATIEMMFQNGVFFLPPGILPEKWPEQVSTPRPPDLPIGPNPTPDK